MQYRLRTLLTQFSIRDLLWAVVVVALLACVVKERLVREDMKAELDRVADQLADVELQRSALAATQAAIKSVEETQKLQAAMQERREELDRRIGEQMKGMRSAKQLDPSFPIYYPPTND